MCESRLADVFRHGIVVPADCSKQWSSQCILFYIETIPVLELTLLCSVDLKAARGRQLPPEFTGKVLGLLVWFPKFSTNSRVFPGSLPRVSSLIYFSISPHHLPHPDHI